MAGVKEWAIYVIAKNRRNPLVAWAARAAATYLKGYFNYSYNFALNGEATVLQRLKPAGLNVIFDVGANHGDWALTVLARYPGARVHCFELAQDTAVKLKANLTGHSNLVINDCGLSDHDGEITYQFAAGHDAHWISTTVISSFGCFLCRYSLTAPSVLPFTVKFCMVWPLNLPWWYLHILTLC